jgi:hypothetical protein
MDDNLCSSFSPTCSVNRGQWLNSSSKDGTKYHAISIHPKKYLTCFSFVGRNMSILLTLTNNLCSSFSPTCSIIRMGPIAYKKKIARWFNFKFCYIDDIISLKHSKLDTNTLLYAKQNRGEEWWSVRVSRSCSASDIGRSDSRMG